MPAGPFSMGCSVDLSPIHCDVDAQPIHTVYIDSFYIDRTEVTNAQYRACVAARVCPPPISVESATRPDYYTNPAYNNYPVIYVSWYNARDYCQWVGRRLPTEAEWEKAARGTDLRLYAWGNRAPSCEFSNSYHCVRDTTAVGSYPDNASPYGALDMTGNVNEWVKDLYYRWYYHTSPYYNPTGPLSTDQNEHLVRGGSWEEDARNSVAFIRLDEAEIYKYWRIGFRCARDDDGPPPTPTPTVTPTPTPTPFGVNTIGPGGGLAWMAYPGRLDLLHVSPGAIITTTTFTLTYDAQPNLQGSLQGIDQFFELEAGDGITSFASPLELTVGFLDHYGAISGTIDLYRLEGSAWVTQGITVTESGPGHIIAWVDRPGTYAVLGSTLRLYLPITLRD
ncbi:MAG: formylglycine-generating enzyme family protein [Anaerolineae bacterium]|nr:formylglycine-generating enzyme family protein [Anaerolineae bacterium]